MIRILFIAIIVFTYACTTNNNSGSAEFKSVDSINGPIFYVYNQSIDLGKISQGERVKCDFNIENRGKSDLIINSVSAGCGCTSTHWNPEPIKPGIKSHIEVEFNSAGRQGKQTKKVYVSSNAQEKEIVLTFTCEVIISNKSQ